MDYFVAIQHIFCLTERLMFAIDRTIDPDVDLLQT